MHYLRKIYKSHYIHNTHAVFLTHITDQLSHPYMTTGKTISLTRLTLVGKVMSLLLNMLSRLLITFLPRCKRLLISWLQSPSAVSLEPRKIKSDTVSTVSPSICHEVIGPDAMILNETSSNLEMVNGFLNFKGIQYKAFWSQKIYR